MAAAIPLYEPAPDRIEKARARIRAAGFDPATVPHAGALTLKDGQLEIEELMALGLQGDALIAVLAGPPVPDPPELTALLASISQCGNAS